MKWFYQGPVLCSALVALPASVMAQADTRLTMRLEEVIVTAQKRSENLQEVPISVVAFDAEKLEMRGIEGIQDLGLNVPGLFASPISNASTGQRLYIRGLGNVDTTIAVDSKVAVYVDGIYSGKANGLVFDQADLERIEVLKGPQGTLYGRNAVAGAINFIPRKASTERMYGQAQIGFGNFNARDYKALINAPVTENFAVKLAGTVSERDGWVENLGPGTDFNGYDRYSGRFDARWRPSSDIVLDYSYDHSRSKDLPSYSQPLPTSTPGFLVALGVSTDPPSADRKDTVTTTSQIVAEESETETDGHSLVASWDWAEDQNLTLRAGYRDLQSSSWFASVVGQNPAGIQAFVTGTFIAGGVPPAAAAALASQYSTLLVSDRGGSTGIDDEHYSLELNQVGSLSERITYVAGVYYFNEDVATPYGADNRPTRPGDLVDLLFANSDRTSLFRASRVESEAEAVFGQLTWTAPVLDDHLRLTIGGRYSKDKRNAVIQRLAPGTYAPAIGALAIDPTPVDADFHSFDPSFIAQFDINDDVMVYGSVVSGYRAGGFNINGAAGSLVYNPATVDRNSLVFDSEDILAYETGLKGDFLDDRLRLNLAVYYYELDNDQQTVSGANLTQRAIVNTASTYQGGELELTVVPIDGLQLGVQWAYVEAESEPFANPFIPGAIVTPENAGAPRNSYTASIDYSTAFLGASDLAFHVDYQHRDRAKPNDASELTDANIANARVVLSFARAEHLRYSLALWGRNLTDDEYQTDISPFKAFAYDNASWGTPRTYGASVSIDF